MPTEIPKKRIVRSKSQSRIYIQDLRISLGRYNDEIDLLQINPIDGSFFRNIEDINNSTDLATLVENGFVEVEFETGFILNSANFEDNKHFLLLSTEFDISALGGESGSTNFLDLTDTPNSYTDQYGRLVRVNLASDGLEFIDGSTLYSPIGHTHFNVSVTTNTVNVLGSISATQLENDTIAIFGISEGTGTKYGIYGEAMNAGINTGIYGLATGGTTNYGIYGQAANGTAYAGYFVGNVTAIGTIAGTTITGANVTSGSDPGHTHTAYSPTNHDHSGVYEPVLTKGNLSELTSSVLTISGGTNSVIGSGTTITVSQATSGTSGYLSSADWSTFNNKQSTLTISTGLTNAAGTITVDLSTGKSGGLTVTGGTGAGDDLSFSTTTHGTKGSYIFSDLASAGTIDANDRVLLVDTSGELKSLANGSNGYYLKLNSSTGIIEWNSVTAGSSTFLDLTDAPDSYTSQSNRLVKVNSSPNGLEFLANGSEGSYLTISSGTPTWTAVQSPPQTTSDEIVYLGQPFYWFSPGLTLTTMDVAYLGRPFIFS